MVWSDPCTDLKYEVVEYLLSLGAHVNVPESVLPSANAVQQFGFGGWNNQGYTPRQTLRNKVQMPIHLAVDNRMLTTNQIIVSVFPNFRVCFRVAVFPRLFPFPCFFF